MTTVQILLAPEALARAKQSIARGETPEIHASHAHSFRGPTFEDVAAYYVDGGALMVRILDAEQRAVEYYYPLHSVARVKVTT